MGVGALAALAMMVPAAPAMADGASASDAARMAVRAASVASGAVSGAVTPAADKVADTSADGVTKVAKTHTPKTAEEAFTPESAADGGSDGVKPYSLDEDDGTQPQPGEAVMAQADVSGLATVGVTWTQQDMTDADEAPTYELRYLTDGTWSDWVELPSVDEDSGTIGVSPSYYVGAATKAEARLTPKSGQTITEAKLVVIDSGYSAAGDAEGGAYVERDGGVTDGGDANSGDVDASDATTATASAATTRTATAGTTATTKATVTNAAAVTATGTIHTREEWWVNGNPAMTWKPDRSGHWKGAIVHHTVDRNNYTQAEVPAMINGIYLYHNVHNGWGDIGYQLIVDRFGGIWEGRDEGVANQIVPASQVVGAQSVGFNYDTFGVSMLGSYHLSVAPTDAQVNSVAAAIAWEFDALGITDPYGTFQYKGTQARITGHGDQSHWAGGSLNRTQCPGQQVWNRMGEIRDKVSGYLQNVSKMPKVSLADGDYYINAVAKDSSGVEIAEGATDDGAVTQLNKATGGENQRFTFTKQQDGSYEIKNVATGKVLDVENGVGASQATVRQWTANGSTAQHWFVRDSGTGYYLQSALGEYVLDLSGGSTADGTKVWLYAPNNSAAQKFGLASVDADVPAGKTVRIVSAADKTKVVDIAGGSTADKAGVQLYGWNGSDAQLYRFKAVGNGVYEIANAKSGKVIEAAGGGTTNGTPLQQYASNGTAAQHWMARTAGSDAVLTFFNVKSAKAMDISGGNTASGTRLQVYTGNGTKAQQWTLDQRQTLRERLDSLAATNKDVVADGTYRVSSAAKNSMVLDVSGGSTANYANVQLYGWNGTDAQIWRVSHDGKGYVTLTNAKSGKVLDVSGGSTADYANVQQFAGNGTWAQKWIAVKNGDGTVTLRSAAVEGPVVDVSGGSTANGANVQIFASNGTKAQRWTFTEAKTLRTRLDESAAKNKSVLTDGGTVTFASKANTSKVMDVSGGSRDSGANVQIFASNGTAAQKWRVSHDKAGYVTLTNVGSGKVLDVAGGSTANGANIQQFASNGTWAQKWIAVKNANGSVTLRSAAAENMVADVAGGSTSNGANVQLYAANGTAAQQWVVK
nr:RICIN domain-containing protein [Bifidobacterium saguinibicoloris]